MIYASCIAAALEASIFTLLLILGMVKAGSGSGAFLIFVPVAWFIIAIRICFTLFLSKIFSDRTLKSAACGVFGFCCGFGLGYIFKSPGYESTALSIVMAGTSMFASYMVPYKNVENNG